MERIVIDGGRRLDGSVRVSGTKNAVLKMLAAALMTPETCVFRNVPRISDVTNMMQLLRGLGADISLSEDGVLCVKAEAIDCQAPETAVRQMRASVQVMGPLLARLGRVRISLPGGCDIGARPIDLHLKGLRALGASLHEAHGWVEGRAQRLVGTDIHLDQPSVGATENLMMAATLAEGTTVIHNAAREPEIAEVAQVLNRMGARVEGAGSDTIRVQGVDELGGCDHEVSPDRIEAGTFMVAGALTGGVVHLHPVIPGHLEAVIAKLRESGCGVETGKDSITVTGGPIHPIQIRTQPYPGFPTDMQPQFVALLACAEGTSLVSESVFTRDRKSVV